MEMTTVSPHLNTHTMLFGSLERTTHCKDCERLVRTHTISPRDPTVAWPRDTCVSQILTCSLDWRTSPPSDPTPIPTLRALAVAETAGATDAPTRFLGFATPNLTE